jgi:hypothetical protein
MAGIESQGIATVALRLIDRSWQRCLIVDLERATENTAAFEG